MFDYLTGLLTEKGATFRVIEHPPEGNSQRIASSRCFSYVRDRVSAKGRAKLIGVHSRPCRIRAFMRRPCCWGMLTIKFSIKNKHDTLNLYGYIYWLSIFLKKLTELTWLHSIYLGMVNFMMRHFIYFKQFNCDV